MCLFLLISIFRNLDLCLIFKFGLLVSILVKVLMEVMGVCNLWVIVEMNFVFRWFSFCNCWLVECSFLVSILSLLCWVFSWWLYFRIFCVCLSIMSIFFRLMGLVLVMELIIILVEVVFKEFVNCVLVKLMSLGGVVLRFFSWRCCCCLKFCSRKLVCLGLRKCFKINLILVILLCLWIRESFLGLLLYL